MVSIVDVSRAPVQQIDFGADVAQKRQRQRQNALQEIAQPLKIQELQGQARDSDIKRGAAAAVDFIGALGPTEGVDPETLNQNWMAAKQAAAQLGHDVGRVPDEFSPQWFNAAKGLVSRAGGAVDTGKVGAQKILADGTVIQSTRGGTVVRGPSGEQLTGQAAANAIKAANEEQVRLSGAGSGAREQAKLGAQVGTKAQIASEVKTAEKDVELKKDPTIEAAKKNAKAASDLSIQAFEKIPAIQQSISIYDDGIAALDGGASSGKLSNLAPSIKKQSILLDQAQTELGLNVISNTTFGALSEGELRLALQSGMPTGLSEPDLREWLVDKKEAQQKLLAYYQDAAQFLGESGNTINMFMAKREAEEEQAKNPSGQTSSGVSWSVE